MKGMEQRGNSGRQFELDIARGLAVIFMVFVHVMIVFSNEHVYDTLYGQTVDIVGGVPAAPVFMFLLGVGVIYSRKADAITYLKRGGLLFLGGYGLNILRTVIPELVLTMQNRSTSELSLWQNVYYGLFNVDILQFAGLAFVFFALVKYMKFDIKIIIGLGIIFGLFNIFVPHETISMANTMFAPITSLFIGGNEGLSYFPFLTWIAYPIAGYVFAYYFIQTENKNAFYKRLSIMSVLVFLSYVSGVFLFSWPTGYESEASYYFHGGVLNVVYISFILVWISVLYFISPAIEGTAKRFLEKTSKYVSNIYFIHWVMIGFLTLFIERESIGLIALVLLTLLIFVVSYYAAKLYVYSLKQLK